MIELTAADAARMSRDEALRTLATADGVPEKDRRIAQLMLAGPEVDGPVGRPRRNLTFVAVHAALTQLSAEVREERALAHADLRELAGGRL